MENNPKSIYINLKPSRRNEQRFIWRFPMAVCIGNATLRGRSRCYALPEDIYLTHKEEIKEYGSKSRNQ